MIPPAAATLGAGRLGASLGRMGRRRTHTWMVALREDDDEEVEVRRDKEEARQERRERNRLLPPEVANQPPQRDGEERDRHGHRDTGSAATELRLLQGNIVHLVCKQ